MLFDDEFVERIPEAPVLSIAEACDKLSETMEDGNSEWTSYEVENVTETFALIRSVEEAGLVQLGVAAPVGTAASPLEPSAMAGYIWAVRDAIAAKAKSMKLSQLKTRFSNTLKAGFGYDFSDGDIQRIQVLISELRNHIVASTMFADAHQQRLLARLEKLQAELHKRVSDLDRFWGLIGDLGVTIGKFGNDAKPIVDRIREITEIVWKSQARAEELPSNARPPALTAPSQED